MSRENVEIVRRGYDALNRGELSLESFGPDFEIVEPPEQPGAETRHGGKGVSDSMDAISEAFDDFRFEPERFIEVGDKVVALLTARGRGKGSGVVVERRVAHVWTLQDRTPARVEIYLDVAPAMKSVGLSEQDARADF
jgi:ketosteroid isomerase-like protein